MTTIHEGFDGSIDRSSGSLLWSLLRNLWDFNELSRGAGSENRRHRFLCWLRGQAGISSGNRMVGVYGWFGYDRHLRTEINLEVSPSHLIQIGQATPS